MLPRLLPFLCAALTGCAGIDGPLVQLTLDFESSVSDASLARLTRLNFSAGGDESGTFSISFSRAAARQERLVYRPRATSRDLTLAVIGLAADDSPLAEGSSGALMLEPDRALDVSVTLGAPGGMVDASVPFDGAVPPAGPLTKLTLVRASTAAPLPGYDPLVDGAVIKLAQVPAADLSILATTSMPASQVTFEFDTNVYSHTEFGLPYMMCGDYSTCPPLTVVGTHTLTVTAYDGVDGGPLATLGQLTRTFTIE